MVKVIEVNTCNNCTHLDHNGLLQQITHYICGKIGRKIQKMKKVPAGFTIDYSGNDNIKIPKWCPLQDK